MDEISTMKDQALARVEGPNLVLRLIRPDDAAYVHGLRSDPAYNTHLSEVRGTVENQRRWIEAYEAREAKGLEFYYVIERRDGVRCGLVRLYDVEGDRFTWGSWILDANKTRKAALESAVLSFGIGFDVLGLNTALVDVRIANEKAQAFYRRLGMKEVQADIENIFFVFSREQFEAAKAGHRQILQEETLK